VAITSAARVYFKSQPVDPRRMMSLMHTRKTAPACPMPRFLAIPPDLCGWLMLCVVPRRDGPSPFCSYHAAVVLVLAAFLP